MKQIMLVIGLFSQELRFLRDFASNLTPSVIYAASGIGMGVKCAYMKFTPSKILPGLFCVRGVVLSRDLTWLGRKSRVHQIYAGV